MPNARRLAATIALAVAATMLVSLPSLASAKPAPARSVKVSLVRQISKLDGQYHSLRNRVKTCPSAATDLRVAARQRTAALRGSSIHRSLANLRLRRARMAAAVVRLGRAAKSCAVAPGITASATALPGPTPGTALVMLPDLLGGVSLDVGPLLGGLPLGDLKLVDASQLTAPLCVSPGASCVGIDAADLLAGVHQLLGANLVASLLNLDLPATLASIRALLGADDLSGLLRVDRVSDTVVRLVPIGPLADLAALPGVAAVPVGLIDLIGGPARGRPGARASPASRPCRPPKERTPGGRTARDRLCSRHRVCQTHIVNPISPLISPLTARADDGEPSEDPPRPGARDGARGRIRR